MPQLKQTTALQDLKERLQGVVDDLKDAVHSTDLYGYRAAMENVVKDIDAQMLEKERQDLINAFSQGMRFITTDTSIPQPAAEDYYNNTFGQTI